MIRRLLSLAAGMLTCWVLYVLCARFFLDTTPAALLAGAAGGVSGFFAAALPAAVCCLLVSLVLGKLPIVKQLWMSIGAIVIAAGLCLFALVYLGLGLTIA